MFGGIPQHRSGHGRRRLWPDREHRQHERLRAHPRQAGEVRGHRRPDGDRRPHEPGRQGSTAGEDGGDAEA